MFSNLAEISMLAALCMTGLTVGAAVALVGGKNSNRTSAIVGTAICIVSMMGVISLDEPFADAQKKEAESGTEYKAVHQDEIKSFVNCYKENGFNVCETKDGKEMVVEHYWKKANPRRKRKTNIKKGDYMFSNFCEIIALAVCIAGVLIGAALALAAGNNGNPVPAVIGIVICIVSFIGICFLEDPFTDAQKKIHTVEMLLICF